MLKYYGGLFLQAGHRRYPIHSLAEMGIHPDAYILGHLQICPQNSFSSKKWGRLLQSGLVNVVYTTRDRQQIKVIHLSWQNPVQMTFCFQELKIKFCFYKRKMLKKINKKLPLWGNIIRFGGEFNSVLLLCAAGPEEDPRDPGAGPEAAAAGETPGRPSAPQEVSSAAVEWWLKLPEHQSHAAECRRHGPNARLRGQQTTPHWSYLNFSGVAKRPGLLSPSTWALCISENVLLGSFCHLPSHEHTLTVHLPHGCACFFQFVTRITKIE